jgi:murein DD-endopeptidase MepM/ murein hydrolase activator NlpD
MRQPYFVVVVAHSLHGRLRRIHIPQQLLYVVVLFALLGCVSVFGFVSSYARMAWKVANYNSLRRDAESLRVRYADLQKMYTQTRQERADLQLFASEVSNAYGLKRKLEGPADISGEGSLVPTYSESLEEYNFLKSANISKFRRTYPRLWQVNVRPSLWPVDGRLIGAFGRRSDPFSGEQAFHAGVDISGSIGTPVRATADGVISHAEFSGGYGRLVVIDHGGGVETYYAHLSRIDVITGQEIRRGEVVGALGRSGRVTAPHLHYELRQSGQPVNPYTSLVRSAFTQSAKKDLPF